LEATFCLSRAGEREAAPKQLTNGGKLVSKQERRGRGKKTVKNNGQKGPNRGKMEEECKGKRVGQKLKGGNSILNRTIPIKKPGEGFDHKKTTRKGGAEEEHSGVS